MSRTSGLVDIIYLFIYLFQFCKSPYPTMKKTAYLQSVCLTTFFISSAPGRQMNSIIYIYMQLNHCLHNSHLQVSQEN